MLFSILNPTCPSLKLPDFQRLKTSSQAGLGGEIMPLLLIKTKKISEIDGVD